MGAADVRFANEAAAAEMLARCSRDDVVLVLYSDLEAAERALAAGVPMTRLVIGHLPQGPGRTPHAPLGAHGARGRARGAAPRAGRRGRTRAAAALGQGAAPAHAGRLDHHHAATLVAGAGGRGHAIVRRPLKVVNARGLHLRAAHALAQLATSLECEVTLGLDGEIVNGKSLLGIATLGATCGTSVDVETSGAGAVAAMVQLEQLFATGFGEGVA
jgi:phosphocarrier protein HPr